MKRLRFQELLLLSESEKTARAVTFHNSVTVIKGANDCGKSCLLKSLYTALGAVPRHVHTNWAKLKVTLLLSFTIDAEPFRMLKMGKQYSLFDSTDNLIDSYSSITRGLGPALADLFDFRLELNTATSSLAEQATPAFLFLPFYFDQDRSWVESWESFEDLNQFSKYRKAIASFHTGLKPNEYYKAKAEKTLAQERQDILRGDRVVVTRVLEKIEHLMSHDQFDINIHNYTDEVDRLLIRCNELRADEERLRDGMVKIENRRASIERQIQITAAAADELGKDFTFAAEDLTDEVECPTCGAEYHNSILERFGIAADEDRLRALLVQMRDELESCTSEMDRKRELVDEVAVHIRDITEILESKQGEVKLQDILRSEGKKEVRTVLRGEMDELNRQIGQTDGEIEDAEKQMKHWSNAVRSKAIMEYYRGRMSLYLGFLNVTELDEASYKEVDCRIKESGSDLPRALLAFYFSILHTIANYSTAAFCPIVMDSPKQQDQDAENWRGMLEFIRDYRPDDSQLIVGMVDDLGIDFGGTVIELTDERQLLQEAVFREVMGRLRPYIDKSLAH